MARVAPGVALVASWCVLLGLFAASGSRAAPPDYALGGLAPDDCSLIIRFDPREDESRSWLKLVDGCTSALVGEEAAAQWRSVRDFSTQLSGSDQPESMLAINFDDASAADWVLATRLHDRGACARGLRDAGARALGGGRFVLPDSSLEIRPLDEWLLAAQRGSSLLDAVEERAAVNDVSSREPGFSDLVESLPRGAVEVVFRHPPPVDGRTALSFQPGSGHEAEVSISGRYAASPLPTRTSSRMDVRMLPRMGRRAAIVLQESGIGVLDPTLIQLSAGMPELMPPAEVRRALAPQRMIVLDGETIRVGEKGLFDVPAMCVAIPFRQTDASGANGSPVQSDEVFDGWMEGVGRTMRGALGAASDDEAGAPIHGGIHHIAMGPGLVAALRGHPVGLAASLNWTTCGHDSEHRWFVVATTPRLARMVGDVIEAEGLAEAQSVEACSAGTVSPEALALQVGDLARIRAAQQDESARADAAMLDSVAEMLASIELLTWRMTRQDDDAIEGTALVRTASPLTGEVGSP